MATWYCSIDGQEYGPFSVDQMRSLAQSGRLRPEHHVRRSDSGTWTPAAKVRGLFEVATPQTPAASDPPPVAPTGAPQEHSAAPLPGIPPVASPAPPVASPAPAAALPTGIPVPMPTAVPIANSSAMPVATPVASVSQVPVDRDGHRSARRKSKQQPYLIFSLLGAALLALIVVAVVMVGNRPVREDATSAVAEAESVSETSAAVETDVEADPALVAVDPVSRVAGSESASSVQVPNVGRWLQAGVQKRIVRDHMRLHVPAAWWASSPTELGKLVVEVEITNLSDTRPLEYHGWSVGTRADGSETALVLAPADGRPIVAEPPEDSPPETHSPLRLSPGETVTRRLQFRIIQRAGTDRFRMILPYGALGLPGCVGFEIPAMMILDGPPEVTPPASPVAAAGQPAPQQPATEEAAAGPGTEPETIGELRSQIQTSVKQPATGETPVPPPVPADPAPRPPTMKDLRRSIEESVEEPEKEAPGESEAKAADS